MFAFGTQGIVAFVRARFVGVFDAAYSRTMPDSSLLLPPQAVPDLQRFVSSPGLWGGLLAAVALITLAIAIRRRAA